MYIVFRENFDAQFTITAEVSNQYIMNPIECPDCDSLTTLMADSSARITFLILLKSVIRIWWAKSQPEDIHITADSLTTEEYNECEVQKFFQSTEYCDLLQVVASSTVAEIRKELTKKENTLH